MNRFYLALCGVTLCASVSAQSIRIKGIVNAADGEPLPGVTVRVKGERTGTITAGDGSFSISADRHATLIFSSIGYTTVDVPVNSRTSLLVKLEDNSTNLNEVVISVPYGTVKKSSFTGSAQCR